MILWLLYPLHGRLPLFNVFRYITFRAANAALMALLLSIFLGPALIRWLRVRQIGQSIREEGPKGHQAKAGTPTERRTRRSWRFCSRSSSGPPSSAGCA